MASAAEDRLAAAFERAPVLVDRLRAVVTAADGADAVVARARAAIAALGEAERVAILDAHPRLGADPRTLSTLSRAEQGAEADAATARELTGLNDAYERRFGFRFVVFVKGRRPEEIAPILRARLARGRSDELATGLEEFLAIARDRLTRPVC